MQKLLRRTAQAERQVSRRAAKKTKLFKLADQRQGFKKRMSGVRDANKAVNEAARRRREDWEMGPLAPQRDTPIKDATGSYWGSLTTGRALAELPDKQIELACRWAGGKKYLCLKAGDRVAIMEGPDRGKIAVVNKVLGDEGHVRLEEEKLQLNYTLSDSMTKAFDENKETFTHINAYSVPIHAVRLVHPIRDPKTGKTRDVVINELAPRGIVRDRPTGRVTWTRVVPGLNIEIPWPKSWEDTERNQVEGTHEDHECDTLRIDVEENTFVPTLLRPPMPEGIIDELRNRYSKFRTRHTAEYIAKKEAEEAEKVARRKMITNMQTPLQELNAKIREERRARGQPVLTDDMLAKIGEAMARNRSRTLAGAGIVEVKNSSGTTAETPIPSEAGPENTAPPRS